MTSGYALVDLANTPLTSAILTSVCSEELERDWKQKFLKMERQFSVRPVEPVKEDHLWRWTTLTGKFPPGPNRSIYIWTEISGNFGMI